MKPITEKVLWAVGITAAASTGVLALVLRKPKPLSAAEKAEKVTRGITALEVTLTPEQQRDLVLRMLGAMTAIYDGTAVFTDEHTFWVLYTHGQRSEHPDRGSLNSVPPIFYFTGTFSFDEFKGHSDCQSWAAFITQPGLDYWNWWMTHCIYNIDPHAEPARFQAAVNQCIENDVRGALQKADVGAVLKDMGIDLGPMRYMIVLEKSARDRLARFGRDMAAQGGKPLPTTGEAGAPIPEPILGMLQASVGAVMVVKLIEMMESSDPKVNPCIKELDFATVFEMFSVTIGTVIGLAIGPALSGTAVILKVYDTIRRLAALTGEAAPPKIG